MQFCKDILNAFGETLEAVAALCAMLLLCPKMARA